MAVRIVLARKNTLTSLENVFLPNGTTKGISLIAESYECFVLEWKGLEGENI